MAKKRRVRRSAGNSARTGKDNSTGALAKALKSIMPIKGRSGWAWILTNILLISVFIYGLYYVYSKSWSSGLSIIVLDLLIILVIKLVLKLKKR